MELTDVMNASKQQANKKKIELFPTTPTRNGGNDENPRNDQSFTQTPTPKKSQSKREPLSKITSSQSNSSTVTSAGGVATKKLLKPTQNTSSLLSPKPTTPYVDKNRVGYKGLEVYPRVFVGGQKFARNYEKLKKKNIRSILNVSKEVKCYYEDEFTYLQIHVADSSEDQIIDYFDEAAMFITNQLNQSNDEENNQYSVLVHCKLGQSRSTSILIAYAMKEMGWTLERSFNHMSSIHPNLQINDGFKIQLMKYEVELFGRNSYEFFRKRISKPVKSYDPSEFSTSRSTPRKSKPIRKNPAASSGASKNPKLLMLR